MYTIKFKIGEQWRAFPAKEYFWGHGILRSRDDGFYVEFTNTETRTIAVTRFNIKVSDMVEGKEVFYILRFDEGTDVMVFEYDFLATNDVFIMQDGKTIDRL
ncbi:MAG TPA: hypothetical protein VJ869_16270 [Sphaerochaeta sp.]|nr:hypothetical protein [Sphaerochaeta sp.]